MGVAKRWAWQRSYNRIVRAGGSLPELTEWGVDQPISQFLLNELWTELA